jgi:hypothetical protein
MEKVIGEVFKINNKGEHVDHLEVHEKDKLFLKENYSKMTPFYTDKESGRTTTTTCFLEFMVVSDCDTDNEEWDGIELKEVGERIMFRPIGVSSTYAKELYKLD